MDGLKANLKRVCVSMLAPVMALIVSVHPCLASKFESTGEDSTDEVLVLNEKNCGFLIDKYLWLRRENLFKLEGTRGWVLVVSSL